MEASHCWNRAGKLSAESIRRGVIDSLQSVKVGMEQEPGLERAQGKGSHGSWSQLGARGSMSPSPSTTVFNG
ncbi:hypothetical protein chiPu_0000160 [Chiloscyllium punctatum]|uniref:Uncharacterized protein n=1 Tax=Chiloscyllium punctatum TaxID=137246 RepID=A0A401RS67_CHIPU|nr:hypothetical protein [Chiloscyllium punctatum]